MHVRHYYSIANFLAGMGIKIYDNYFSSYNNQTYQQLFGQFTAIARGPVAYNAAQGILPQDLINQWGNNLAQQVATEWEHWALNVEHSPGWNGDAFATVTLLHTSLWNFMSEWSTVTTIAAGVIDGISQQIHGSMAISLALIKPFLGVEKINLMYQVGFDFSKFHSWEIKELVKKLGIDIEITEFYKIIDHMTIHHDIIERHIGDSKVEQDTISVIIEEVEVNNLQGIVTELNTSSWSEDFAITT
jgi:hypothetical protein